MNGLIGGESISYNITIVNLKRISGLFQYIFRKREARHVNKLVKEINIQPPDIRKDALFLSGGNQQKVIIAKALYSNVDIYIFVEPTTGVDIGARRAIYKKIRELSNDFGIIIISTDVEEIFGCCDDFLVLYNGNLNQKGSVDSYTADDLLSFAISERSNA